MVYLQMRALNLEAQPKRESGVELGSRSSTVRGSEAENPALKQGLDPQVCREVTGDRMELRSPDWFSEGPKAKTRPLPESRQMDQGWPKPWRIKVRSSLEHAFQRANAFWIQVLPNHALPIL